MEKVETKQTEQESNTRTTSLQRPIVIKAAKNNQERESTEYRLRF